MSRNPERSTHHGFETEGRGTSQARNPAVALMCLYELSLWRVENKIRKSISTYTNMMVDSKLPCSTFFMVLKSRLGDQLVLP